MEVMNKVDDTKTTPIELQEPTLERRAMLYEQLEGFQKFDGDGMVATVGCRKTGQEGIQLGRTLVSIQREIRLHLSDLTRILQGESPRSFE